MSFSYMRVHCPICKSEMDGMRGYGREARCCDAECYREWEWRRTLAIMGCAMSDRDQLSPEFRDLIRYSERLIGLSYQEAVDLRRLDEWWREVALALWTGQEPLPPLSVLGDEESESLDEDHCGDA